MSGKTMHLLEEFETLPEQEKTVFAAEVLRRAVPFDSGPIEDAEVACAADDLFLTLDSEENDSGAR